MTRRFFLPSVRTGLAGATTKVEGARPTFSPTANFEQGLAGADPVKHAFEGPALQVIGPGDVLGVDRSTIVRQEPAPGAVDAVENNLVTLDLADAALPWLVSLPGMKERPWIALVVLRDDEGELKPGAPLPTVSVPAKALPDLTDAAAWAHVEVRLEDGEEIAAVLDAEARVGTDRVVARLVCPRRLEPNRGWLACLVPATRAGVAAGLGQRPGADDAGQAGWGLSGPARLPVYHSWEFRTGPAGSFEDMARRVQPVPASSVPGLGSRMIDVRHPWPHEDLLPGAPNPLTLSIQGALRLPGSGVAVEAWSDAPSQQTFRGLIRTALDAPGQAEAARDGDRDEGALAPPLFGSHHTGHREVPPSGWMEQLNTEVRYRIAASLGSRYVQVEQEFLMERAWEQVGEIREANRLLAATELATEASQLAQAKHLAPLTSIAMTQLADPMRDAVRPVAAQTLTTLLAGSAAPDGTGSTAFRRLARGQGAVARRTARSGSQFGEALSAPPVLSDGLDGTPVVPLQPSVSVLAGVAIAPSPVALDTATLYGTGTMVDLLGSQSAMFGRRDNESASDGLGEATAAMTGAMGGGMAAAPVASGTLRLLRRQVIDVDVLPLPTTGVTMTMGIGTVADGLRAEVRPMAQQLRSIATRVITEVPGSRVAEDPRPLRRIMAHPRFGFPIGAELLTRWPEWTVPGITTFPENSATLMETNPEFVEAALVGLNQEFNRELLWREYPTDQAGTPFARFWPGGAGEFGEIARWDDGQALGSHDPLGGVARVVVLVRADVLARYPGTLLLAAKSESKKVPNAPGAWKDPIFSLPVDDHTTIFGFDLTLQQVKDELYLFVLREPMRGTQFGFDLKTADTPPLKTWADLTWDDVPTRRSFVVARNVDGKPPRPSSVGAADPHWGPDPVDLARIAFQRPFQLAFSPKRLIG